MTAELCTVNDVRKYKDTIIMAARTIDKGIIGLGENKTWERMKIHGVPFKRYMGKGTNGLDKLREEIQAENAGMVIPTAARWLGRVPQLKEKWAKGDIMVTSVVFVIRGQDESMRLLKDGVRICGFRYRVKKYQEERPDTQCSNCAKWGHVDSHCSMPETVRCNLCAEKHRTDQHKCPVIGCTRGMGQ
jgi:hypothetical protein